MGSFTGNKMCTHPLASENEYRLMKIRDAFDKCKMKQNSNIPGEI